MHLFQRPTTDSMGNVCPLRISIGDGSEDFKRYSDLNHNKEVSLLFFMVHSQTLSLEFWGIFSMIGSYSSNCEKNHQQASQLFPPRCHHSGALGRSRVDWKIPL